MGACIRALIVVVLAVGCTTHTDKIATDHQGLAEVHVNAAQLLAANVTRVTLAAAGQSLDLVLSPITGTFDGTLVLPSGTQSLVASAFSGDTLVGQSQPVAVDVQPGVVTRVMVRILDLTTDTPIYGPIVDSLSFPTTAEAGTHVTFAISVVAPLGDPVSYSWVSDCPDSAFSTPDAAATDWSKPTQGPCKVTVTATSNGFSVVQSFGIVVFPAGSGSGAVTVNSVFVSAPLLNLSFFSSGGLACSVDPGSNASCQGSVTSPGTAAYSFGVINWGSFSNPGTLEVSDNCGGHFGTSFRSSAGFVGGDWLPPIAGGICIIAGRAVNSDGVVATLSAAILTHPGSPATSQPPQINAHLDFFCPFSASGTPTDCGSFSESSQVFLNGAINWVDGLPGSFVLTDDCAVSLPELQSPSFFNESWIIPREPGRICTTTLQATSLQGSSSSASARYTITTP